MSEFSQYADSVGEVGTIFSVTSSLVYASGLPGARVGEKVISESGAVGIVEALEENAIEILICSNELVDPGSRVTRTGSLFRLPVGMNFLGRSLDALGNPVDGGNPIIQEDDHREIDPLVMGIKHRVRVQEPFNTGVTVVDTLIPLGRGQRELVIGDAKSGKSSFLLQAILNQKRQEIICIYVGVGKRKTDIRWVEDFFKSNGLTNTMLIGADAASSPGMIYLAPFVGLTFAEYFRDQGKDVVVVLDDLTAHGKSYREIALQGKKSPGREGYPGDIFYLHSRLLERGGHFKLDNGKVSSITILPVVQTVVGDFTGLIPTNVMSMTDGHVYFDTDQMQKGNLPPVNVFLSVSRVGNQTRSQLQKEINQEVRNILSAYRSTLTFSRFGTELSEASKVLLKNGEKINTLFNQNQYQVVPINLQTIYFGLLLGGFWDSKIDAQVDMDKEKFSKAYSDGKLKVIEDKITKLKNLTEFKDFIKANYSLFLKVVS